jgi:hypothetical protein
VFAVDWAAVGAIASFVAAFVAVAIAVGSAMWERSQRARRERQRDLDETRRTTEIARLAVANRIPVSPELAATLMNAYASHLRIMDDSEALAFGLRLMDAHTEADNAPVDNAPRTRSIYDLGDIIIKLNKLS